MAVCIGQAPGEAILHLSQSADSPSHLLCQSDYDNGVFAHIYVEDLSCHEHCDWLASNLKDYAYLCNPSDPVGAFKLCPDTCGTCIDFYTTNYKLDVDSGLSNKRMNKVGTSTVPCASCQLVACDDDKERRFFMHSTDEAESCVWLAACTTEQMMFCSEVHPSQAHNICRETCSACIDDYEDTVNQPLHIVSRHFT
jgi:hypothetical protein